MQRGGINVYYNGKQNIVVRDHTEYSYQIGEMILEVIRLLPSDERLAKHLYEYPRFEDPLTPEGMVDAIHWMIDIPSQWMPPALASIFQGTFIDLFQGINNVIWKDGEGKERYLNAVNKELHLLIQRKLLGERLHLDNLGGFLGCCFSSYLIDVTDFRAGFEGLIAKDNGDATDEELQNAKRFIDIFQKRYTEQELGCVIMYEEDMDKFITVFTISDFRTLLAFEYSHMKETGSRIRICENCGRFFIPENRSDEKYCGFLFDEDSGKTCKDVGAERKWQQKVDESPALKRYRKKYAALGMAIKRARDNGDEWIGDLIDERAQLNKMKADMIAGNISEQKFMDWIDKRSYGGKKHD